MGINPAALRAALMGDLDNARVASTPGGIEAQEAAGQMTFCASATLPKAMQGCTRENFESMGFKFGADADDIFVSVTLPPGWTKKATDHSMWSNLVDEKGRKRAAMFYKAAFYDRNAHVRLTRRYSVGCYEGCNADGTVLADRNARAGHWLVSVKDGDTAIHVLGTCKDGEYDAHDELRNQADAWLKERYPDWNNALAYWD